uniref:Uncharacterized protein n=1 Tax=Globisporangium ultimum (strain ATCC 200006 / CBS 805.95 / DAOM BR144) TaxID=431595 RepID=K3WIL2_GLOUD
MVVDSTFAFRRVPLSSQEPKTEHAQQLGVQRQPPSTQRRDDKLLLSTEANELSDGASDTNHVPTLDELVEKARTDAIIELQRWWRRTHGNHKRITELQELCQDHASVLIAQKRRARIRAKIRELVLHAVFLYFYTVNTHFDVANEQLFRFTNAPYLNADFKTADADVKQFYGIASAEELFAWLRGPFLRLSYPQASSTSASSSVHESDVVFQNSRVVGGIRIGQLRVKQSNCTSRITSYFSSALTESSPRATTSNDSWLYCYGSQRGEYRNSAEYESRESFGGSSSTSFKFTGHNNTETTAVERSTMFSSMAGGSFPSPAFSVIMPRVNSTQASQILLWLENDAYIDRHTRVVVLDVNLVNVMLRTMLLLRFIVEFPASGGVVPSLVATSAPVTKSFLYYEDDWWHTLCSCIVLLFYGFFLATEIFAHTGRQRRKAVSTATGARKALRYSTRYGAAARTISLVVYFVVWLLRLLALIHFPSTFPLALDTFVSLRPFVEAFHVSQQLVAINTCLCWLVLLLLLRMTKHIDIFVRTLLLAKTKLLALLVCVALLMYGYASAFVVAVGPESSPFRSVAAAMTSLLGMAVGRATPSSRLLQQDHRDAPAIETVLFTGFVVIHVVIIANLVLVMISDAYHKALDETKVEFSSSKRMHLVVEVIQYAKALVVELHDLARRLLSKLPGFLKSTASKSPKLVPRASRLSVVRAISSSGAMQKSANLISSQVGALSDFGGRLMNTVVASPRDEFEDDCDYNGAYNDDEDANERRQHYTSTRSNYTYPGSKNSQGVFDGRDRDRRTGAGGAQPRRSCCKA